MTSKRRLSESREPPSLVPGAAPFAHDADDDHRHGSLDFPSAKRARLLSPSRRRRSSSDAPRALSASSDLFASLSDEILIRILSHFSPSELLTIAPTSKRLNRLTNDSQIWRAHYWWRFVRPRAHLIPRFRKSHSGRSKTGDGTRTLRFDGKRSIYADGGFGRNSGLVDPSDSSRNVPLTADWKSTFKRRHNWERGRCYVEELQLQDDTEWVKSPERKTYAKFVDGLAVTVDSCWTLRAWDLKTRKLIAQTRMDTVKQLARGSPTCLALDSQHLRHGTLDVLVGFEDGSFGVWALDVEAKTLALRYRHTQQLFGPVVSVAYMHPYLLTARRTGFIVLYSFNYPDEVGAGDSPPSSSDDEPNGFSRQATLAPPRILDTIKSVNTIPQAVSIRKLATSYVASVAYSFNTISGWCIGIQDLDIQPSSRLKLDAVSSRLASTLPMPTRLSSSGTSTPESSPLRGSRGRYSWEYPEEPESDEDEDEFDRPISICYSHPYLLATMPDNTLMLHLCTSTANSLSISPGTRLWGHTSGISDAVITPWGRAVSVSARGDEMRLWKVEGGIDGTSVEVRPRQYRDGYGKVDGDEGVFATGSDVGDKRKWVAFDEEMVISLKERTNGRESFMVYDFT